MKAKFTFKGTKVAEQLQELARRKLAKIERHIHGDAEAHLIFSSLRGKAVVEVNVYAEGLLLHGTDTSANHSISLRKVMERLERRLKRQKEKIIKAKRQSKEELNKEQLPLQEMGKVTRRRQIVPKPLGVEEVVAQMRSSNEDFFVFKNAQTGQINVLYRMKDGNFCLIEPSP